MSDELDAIEAQIEALRQKASGSLDLGAQLSSRLNELQTKKYRAQKRAFEASIKRRALLQAAKAKP